MGFRHLSIYMAVWPQLMTKLSYVRSVKLLMLQAANIQAGISLHKKVHRVYNVTLGLSDEPSHMSRRTQYTHSESNSKRCNVPAVAQHTELRRR